MEMVDIIETKNIMNTESKSCQTRRWVMIILLLFVKNGTSSSVIQSIMRQVSVMLPGRRERERTRKTALHSSRSNDPSPSFIRTPPGWLRTRQPSHSPRKPEPAHFLLRSGTKRIHNPLQLLQLFSHTTATPCSSLSPT